MPYIHASASESKRTQDARPLPVPVIPGGPDPLSSNKLIGPPEDARKTIPDPEVTARRRRWAASGAVVLLSSVSFVTAFTQRDNREVSPPATCKTVAASETAQNTVRVQLDRPAGNEKVWVGNYTGVMEAHPVPGNPTTYSLETAGYLHEDVIGVYIGSTMCENRLDLGGVRPGDEQFFVG